MVESTQYGLKNSLEIKGLERLEKNIFKIQLRHKSSNHLYLFIVFLDSGLIRFHYKFNDNFNLLEPNEYLDLHNFDITNGDFIKVFEENENAILINTEILRLEIHKKNLQIKIFDHEGDLISADENELGFWSKYLSSFGSDTKPDKHEIRCYKRFDNLSQAPIIYGLGDKTGDLNRFGRRFRNEPIDALGFDAKFTDPLYKDIPFFIVLDRETKKSHGIFFDNFYPKFFDFGLERKPSPYIYFGASAGELNYYFIYGHEIKSVCSKYLELTGKPPKWPSYSYGYLGSGMAYTEKEKSAEKLLEVFSSLKNKELDMTAFHLSSGYVMNQEGKRHQFIWNKEKFTDPVNFSKQANDLGVKLCANVKPVLLCSHPWYEEAKDLDLFIKNKEGKNLIVDYWGGPGSYINFLNPNTKTWWKEKLKTYILENGIAGIWNDNNEYEIFETHSSEGQLGKQILEMSKLAYETTIENYQLLVPGSWDLPRTESQEPKAWILSRSGYAGIQKYAQTWTGDNYSSWQALQYDIPLLSNLGLSGIIHCGSDIGGFWGPEPDPELLLRWIQYGVFTPRFCIHSYKENPTQPDSHEISHPKFFKIIQKFFAIRKKLLPYLENAAAKASEEGIPIMRPLVYDFQHDINCHERNFEYMFGNKYLVAPIYETKAESREVYLPEIIDNKNQWIHYFNGKKYRGGELVKVKASFDEIPIFERDF